MRLSLSFWGGGIFCFFLFCLVVCYWVGFGLGFWKLSDEIFNLNMVFVFLYLEVFFKFWDGGFILLLKFWCLSCVKSDLI